MRINTLFRKKPITSAEESESTESKAQYLKRSLSTFDLILIGIGAIVGAGIFTITGTAAATKAGPGIILSFIISAIGCGFAGLCYAEMASMIPKAGSAYTYAYSTLGEIFAWMIGWDLVLEYAVGAIAVAIGWSGYLVSLLNGFGLHIPYQFCHGPFEVGVAGAGIVNLPAIFIVVLITFLLILGTKLSAKATGVMVFIKIAIILTFLLLGFRFVKPANWQPFLPFGLKGVISGAGLIFFAYIGFDAVTTLSEETKNPKRALPIGILGSLAMCTLLYIVVSIVLTGMVSYKDLNNSAPVAFALQQTGINFGASLVSFGAVFGLGSVLMVMIMGQPRIFFAMSRDGLLPKWFSHVHPRFHTPSRSILITGFLIAICAGTLNIEMAGELTSIGTLFAFILVCIGVLVLRFTKPHLYRPFKTPLLIAVAPLGSLTCMLMMAGLGKATWIRFGVWLLIGFGIYFAYSRRHSQQQERLTKPIKNKI